MTLHLRTLAAATFLLLGAAAAVPTRAAGEGYSQTGGAGAVARQIEGLRRQAADYEAAGRERLARAAYQRAIQLGDRNPATYDGLLRTTQAIEARGGAGTSSQLSARNPNAASGTGVGASAAEHSTAPSEGAQAPERSGAAQGSAHGHETAGAAQAGPGTGRGKAAGHAAAGDSVSRWERNLPFSWFLLVGLGGFALTYLGRWLRGRGDLLAVIDYPPECRGEFSVRLTRRREPPRPSEGGRNPADDAGAKARRSSRFEQHMVAREAHFRGVPARQYVVVVEGVLRDAQGDTSIQRCLEQKSVRVSRGLTERVQFEFEPREAPVEVVALWKGRPLAKSRVGVRGDPGSVRFSLDGVRRLAFPRGEYDLMIGGSDLVVERKIVIDSWRPVRLAVELSGGEGIAFSGCPAAVEPYLQGDLWAAARALEGVGQTVLAHRLRARHHAARGEPERAAEQFEAAGDLTQAADQRVAARQADRAAELYERSGDHARAAQLYLSAGQASRAGAAFQAAGDFTAAVRCFREVGDPERLIDALERAGSLLEAAKMASERGDWIRAVRTLQQVSPRDLDYAAACQLLARAYDAQGKTELALHKLDESMTLAGTDTVPVDVLEWYAEVLEKAGRAQQALGVLEQVRSRSPSRAHLGTRIDELRKRISVQRIAFDTAERSDHGLPAFPLGGRYEILEQVGRGGMGIVYRARDKRLDRIVALKRLTDDLRDHPKAIELFLREARSAARLNHRNIVTVYDVDQEDGVLFITMEFLEGQSLNTILRRVGRLTPRDVARFGIQTAIGLQFAHDHDIVHRDIKPANLFLPKDRTLKIMDFGIAKMLAEVRQGATVIGGTPAYMAPEQAAGRLVDGRADLYALGVTLYEMLTGGVPDPPRDAADAGRPTADPRGCTPGVPDALAELVLKLVAQRPEDRPAHARDVSACLQGVLEKLGPSGATPAAPAASPDRG
ncbi:MAG TPA: protein kinase [Myxococcota bacterium]|nr:protein kinase [Myxococcota bacterium]